MCEIIPMMELSNDGETKFFFFCLNRFFPSYHFSYDSRVMALELEFS